MHQNNHRVRILILPLVLLSVSAVALAQHETTRHYISTARTARARRRPFRARHGD
jgi:hypothetical protein